MTETHSPAERALLLVSASSEEQAEPVPEPASAEAEFFLSFLDAGVRGSGGRVAGHGHADTAVMAVGHVGD